MFKQFILIFILISALICTAKKYVTSFIQDSNVRQIQSLSSLGATNQENSILLEEALSGDLNKVKASIGVILFHAVDNKKFVLLGRERRGKCGTTWCELGGSVERGESFLEAAIREAEEESGGAYCLQANDILNNGIVYYYENKQQDGSVRRELYILLKIGHYYSADTLCNAVNQQEKNIYQEKDDFKWISLPSLLAVKQNPCELEDIDGYACNITLRKFFYETLQRDDFQGKLASIVEV